jgi:putative FmdB family regulatory protein
MPTYEYVCQKCGHEFEQFQSMKDAPLTQCPKCRKRALKRLVGGGAGLIFKGTGFYITDYRKPGAKGGEGGAKKEGGGDAKPAAKPAESKSAAPAAGTPAKGKK